MSPIDWAGLIVAGAAGAPIRFLVKAYVEDRIDSSLPWGTLLVNVSGSLVLGVLTGLTLHHGLPKTTDVILGVGFCGAYTTFSTFTFETVQMLEQGAVSEALHNALGSLITCAAAAAAGVALASL